MVQLITSDNQQSSLTGTWDSAATTYTAWKLNVTDTASNAASLLMDVQIGGTSKIRIRKDGAIYGSESSLHMSSGVGGHMFGLLGSSTAWSIGFNGFRIRNTYALGFADFTGGVDAGATLSVFQDANDIWAQRRATNAQTFRIYNTYTDASNYERGKIEWSSNVLKIGTEKAGTGSSRNVEIQYNGTTALGVDLNNIFTSNGYGIYINPGNNNTPLYAINSNSTFGGVRRVILAPYTGGVLLQDGSGVTMVMLGSDGAGVFALRNSTNAQIARVYNTFTDGSNYERAKFGWESNVLRIGGEKAGTGTARALELQTDGTTRLTIGATTGTVSLNTSNTLAVLSLQNSGNTANSGYEICVGSPGNYDGYLMFRRTGTATPGDFYLPNGGAPVFSTGVAVGDGYSFNSASSGSLAFWMPYRNNTGDSAQFSFRNHLTAAGIFHFFGYWNGGSGWNQVSNMLVLRTNAAADGRIGIGTNNPSGKLGIVDTDLSGSGSLATPILDLAQTWNTTGTPTAIKLNVTDTASNANSLLLDLQVGGSSKVGFNKSGSLIYSGQPILRQIAASTAILSVTGGAGVFVGPSGATTSVNCYANINNGITIQGTSAFSFALGSDVGEAHRDLLLLRDGSGVLAQRNGTNEQAFRLYNTYTDASNYERGKVEWKSNVLTIGTEKGGTGTARALELQTDGTARLSISEAGIVSVPTALYLGSNSNVRISTPQVNVLELWAAGAPYFRLHIGTWTLGQWSGVGLTIGTQAQGGVTNRAGDFIKIKVAGGSGSADPGAFIVETAYAVASGTTAHTSEESFRVRTTSTGVYIASFGGTTSSYPALKRDSATLKVRLADDSADAALTCAELTASSTSLSQSITGTSSDPTLLVTPTWNTTGTPTAIKLNVTNIASNSASLLMDLKVVGETPSAFKVDRLGTATAVQYFQVNVNNTRKSMILEGGFTTIDAGYYRWWNGNNTATGSADLFLYRDAAGALAQRNGTNAQSFRVYNTYTDSANYERGKIEWVSNALRIGTEKAGTGAARALEFQTDGTTRLSLTANGQYAYFHNTKAYGANWGLGYTADAVTAIKIGLLGASVDFVNALLESDGPHIIAQRTGVNAQTFRVYNTYTSSTSYERGKIEWASNVLRIGTEKGSAGGTARALEFQTDGVTRLTIDTGGDITATSRITCNNLFLNAGGSYALFTATGDGSVRLTNNAGNSFSLLQFGGTTSSYPALKRDSAAFRIRLADDSADAALYCSAFNANDIALSESITGSSSDSTLLITPTWNTTGTPTAIKLNVTDTASNAASLLMDLQVGGSSRFSVRKDGYFSLNGTGPNSSPAVFDLTQGSKFAISANRGIEILTGSGWAVTTTSTVGFGLSTSSASFHWVNDLHLYRDGAGILAQRNTTNAQALRIYRTWTDSSNYEAIELAHATYSSAQYSILRTITAGTGADNISLVVSPSGTGAFQLALPDGTGTGGNARGANAVDLQTKRTLATEVASGTSSMVLGGDRNISSGTSSITGGFRNTASATTSVALGSDNTASGGQSFSMGSANIASAAAAFALGSASVANKRAQIAQSAGQFSTAGDAQRSTLVMRNSTADATPTELFLDGSSLRATIPSNTRWFADVKIIATNNSSGASAVSALFHRRCLLRRFATANTTEIIGELQTIGSDIGTSYGSPPDDIAVDITADITNASLKIEVTGRSGVTIRWVAEVSLVEVAYA